MRESGGQDLFDEMMSTASQLHASHMSSYGTLNDRRMTGDHETSSFEEFSFAVASRGVSIRIPNTTAKEWKGYAEDRRPASNCDPYRVAMCVLEYVK